MAARSRPPRAGRTSWRAWPSRGTRSRGSRPWRCACPRASGWSWTASCGSPAGWLTSIRTSRCRGSPGRTGTAARPMGASPRTSTATSTGGGASRWVRASCSSTPAPPCCRCARTQGSTAPRRSAPTTLPSLKPRGLATRLWKAPPQFSPQLCALAASSTSAPWALPSSMRWCRRPSVSQRRSGRSCPRMAGTTEGRARAAPGAAPRWAWCARRSGSSRATPTWTRPRRCCAR
mmetsp:Transcript_100921/g.226264  ORF Transcript_100921/g.226264 Transcript_100921/m.226264 type:complete len:233 (+) Transcript_100921:58-756(+)